MAIFEITTSASTSDATWYYGTNSWDPAFFGTQTNAWGQNSAYRYYYYGTAAAGSYIITNGAQWIIDPQTAAYHYQSNQLPISPVEQERQRVQARLARTRRIGNRISASKSRGERLLDAAGKGKLLLQEIIGDVLFRRLERRGFVDLPSMKHPEIRYRLRYNRQIGLVRKVGEAWVESREHLCIHPNLSFVPGDKAATHAILCLFDEDMLWRVANHNRTAA